ncbi:Protein PLANT CADMIUM RESISTANCE 9 [Madurella mycetomatis]|uniref:Protein PLANT CADMIUM RESISTANCE 9 n=1 Tax=Madurella mycetomatis TaxID=100816 RepID=A0A175W2F1_9PEZI|nr:Protein PLANT CADMIUM RESISTANCE 9 [Madurella mycetomatis]KXX81105.1 Protein PLANT CADMIUM RESISTANCE 9 [Madurella mycetomatis]
MAAPQQDFQQQQKPAAAQGPINDADVAEWTARFNDLLARPGEYINSRSPEGAQSWKNSFFEFWNPIDTCLFAWCVPCVVFGRTHHRLRKSPTLEGYEPINTSCLLMCASGCVGLWWLPVAMQRADIRTKHNLEGSCLFDIATSCCCGCCSIVQQDKEAADRELGNGAVQEAYKAPSGMSYPGEQKP